MFFLGRNEPREWVVWDITVPANDDRELLHVECPREDRDGKFTVQGHKGQYVKWAVSGFTSSGLEDATEFILDEVRFDWKRENRGVVGIASSTCHVRPARLNPRDDDSHARRCSCHNVHHITPTSCR